MSEKIAFENGRIFNFEGLVTLTLSLDWVILHTIVHHSSTSTYMTHFIEIEVTFCGLTDVHTNGRTFETVFIRSTLSKRRPKKSSFDKINNNLVVYTTVRILHDIQ